MHTGADPQPWPAVAARMTCGGQGLRARACGGAIGAQCARRLNPGALRPAHTDAPNGTG